MDDDTTIRLLLKVENLDGRLGRLEQANNSKLLAELTTKIALMDDSIFDLEKSFVAAQAQAVAEASKADARADSEKKKSMAMLICILTCAAAIIAGVLQGLLTNFSF